MLSNFTDTKVYNHWFDLMLFLIFLFSGLNLGLKKDLMKHVFTISHFLQFFVILGLSHWLNNIEQSLIYRKNYH